MFGWFKKRPNSLDQMRDFVDRLSQARAEDLGLSVATVEHTANTHWLYGDFYQPQHVMAKRPDVIAIGLSEVPRLQASGLGVMAVGWIVWVHTFRATQDPTLIPLAKSMWSLLVRGAPYAFGQSATLEPMLGYELRVEQPDRIPSGLA